MLKEPRPGRVKTRLGRDIGMVEAAWWFRHQTARLIRRFYEIGIFPDWWKLEPMRSANAWDLTGGGVICDITNFGRNNLQQKLQIVAAASREQAGDGILLGALHLCWIVGVTKAQDLHDLTCGPCFKPTKIRPQGRLKRHWA